MTTTTRWFIGVQLCLLGAASTVAAQADWAYLGQAPPGDEAKLFAPQIMQHKVHSAPTFGPDDKEIYWSSVCEPDQIRRIMVVRYEDGRWSDPAVASFSGTYNEDQPFVTYDGAMLYFCSKRPLPGQADPPPHIWVTHRTGQGWGTPALLGPPVFTDSIQWTPSLTRDGTLCYDSAGIRLAEPKEDGFAESQRLPETINNPAYQNWTPFIAPDGRFVLYASGRGEADFGSQDIYISYRHGDEWTEPINLGPKVNTARQERFPGLSPDGKYLFFTRHYDTPCYHDLYWIEARAVLPHLQGEGESSQGQDVEDQEKIGPRYKLIWQSPAVFRTPEAVLYDSKRDVLYVSNFNVDGGFLAGRSEPRHRGEFISKVDPAGNVLALEWVTGLEAPTGMAIHNDALYVVERGNLVQIDIESARIVGRVAIPDASFPNDVAIDAEGTGYISDNGRQPTTGIYRYADGHIEPWIPSTEVSRPNGLLVDGSELIAYDNNRQALVAVGLADRQVRTIARVVSDASGMGDGLVKLAERTYLVTSWSGPSWLVRPDGSVTTLLDTSQLKPIRGGQLNNADGGFVPGKNLWVIPTFMDHRVLAYELDIDG